MYHFEVRYPPFSSPYPTHNNDHFFRHSMFIFTLLFQCSVKTESFKNKLLKITNNNFVVINKGPLTLPRWGPPYLGYWAIPRGPYLILTPNIVHIILLHAILGNNKFAETIQGLELSLTESELTEATERGSIVAPPLTLVRQETDLMLILYDDFLVVSLGLCSSTPIASVHGCGWLCMISLIDSLVWWHHPSTLIGLTYLVGLATWSISNKAYCDFRFLLPMHSWFFTQSIVFLLQTALHEAPVILILSIPSQIPLVDHFGI